MADKDGKMDTGTTENIQLAAVRDESTESLEENTDSMEDIQRAARDLYLKPTSTGDEDKVFLIEKEEGSSFKAFSEPKADLVYDPADVKEGLAEKDAAPFAGLCMGCCLTLLLTIGVLLTVSQSFTKGNAKPDFTPAETAGHIILAIVCFLFVLVGCCCCCACVGSCMNGLADIPTLEQGHEKDKAKFSFKRWNTEFKKDCQEHASLMKKSAVKLPEKAAELLKKKAKKEKQTKAKAKKDAEKGVETRVAEMLEEGLGVADVRHKLRPTVFVVDFAGDELASQVAHLRDQVSVILKVANVKTDEVVVRLESPGGAVAHYGLAAAQLLRLKNAGLQLTVCVDVVAASGGYMMACVASRIVAAPFAYIGSIGVVIMMPNFNRVLDKNSVDVVQLTAGKFKRTVDPFTPITEEGKKKLQEELADCFQAFKMHVGLNRKGLEKTIEEVATGEAWLAVHAKKRGLVDEIGTSDELLQKMAKHADVVVLDENKSKLHFLEHYMDGLVRRGGPLAGLLTAPARWGLLSGAVAERYFQPTLQFQAQQLHPQPAMLV